MGKQEREVGGQAGKRSGWASRVRIVVSVVAHGNFRVQILDRFIFSFHWSFFIHFQGARHALTKQNLSFYLGSETSTYWKIQHREERLCSG